LKEVMDMRRYLFVLDMDLLAMDEEHDLEPINYLVAKQEQEPCEVVVLSLADTGQAKLPAIELILGARSGKYPVAPQPDHDIGAAAEHRMDLAVRHLRAIGCRASGLVSDQALVKAVRAETASHDYDEVILATGRQGSTRLARITGLDPVQQLRRKWGKRLTVFQKSHREESPG
jgi:hypothetical protein